MSNMDIEDTNESKQSSVGESHKSSNKNRRLPTCTLCRNHNLENRSADHKRFCLGQYCVCELCCDRRVRKNESAAQTKQTREKKQDLMIKNKSSNLKILINPSEPVKPFVIFEEVKHLLPNCYREHKIIFKKQKSNHEKEVFELKTKNRKANEEETIKSLKKKRKANEEEPIELLRGKRKANEEKTLEAQRKKYNSLEDLLHYTLYNCLVYDNICATKIWTSVIEIVAIILKYNHSSNLNGDAENSLCEAKNLMLPYIHEIRKMNLFRHLQNPKDDQIYYYFLPSSTVERPTYMTHPSLNGIMLQNPHLWSDWSHHLHDYVTGSTNTYTAFNDISPKPSTEPSTYYRSITDGQ